MTEYLFFASNFNRWAGPNNPLLDLGNHLHENSNIDLKLVTHDSEFVASFQKWIRFPVLPILRGSSSNPRTRLANAPVNVLLMRRLITSLEMPASRIFVNASIDTLFEAHHATNRRIATGYNVLGNEASSTLFNMLDHLAVRTSVGKIVAHTHYQKNLYMKMGIEKNNVRVIPHCIDLKRIEKSAEDRNTELDAAETTGPIIFYGGRLSVDKGIKELLRCYHQISKEYSATLVLVGDGPLKGWILQKKKEIESETQDSSIVFLGAWQPPEVLLSIMRKSDIVVLPSYHEMCPIILLEAMCLRKAIVSTRFGGPQEIITNGENGIYINPHDESELKTALVKLIIDSRLRTRLGTNAFRTLMERYEVSVVAPEFIRFLEGD